MSKNQTSQLGHFDDKLETFTNEVLRIEKNARKPEYADEKSGCYAIDTDKATIPSDSKFTAESVFARVRTKKCLPNQYVARDMNTSRPSIDDSFGQILVERVYFAENRDEANIKNSQEKLQCTLSNPYRTQTRHAKGLSFETPEVNQKYNNGSSVNASLDNGLKTSQPLGSDAQLFAKRNTKNSQDYAINGLKSNKSGNVDVTLDAGGKRCAYTERNPSRVINSTSTAALCYKQRQEQTEKNAHAPFIQNFNMFAQSHENGASFNSTISEERESLTTHHRDVQTIQPIETRLNYFKPSLANVQMAQNQVHSGANHVMRDYFTVRQGINSRFNPRMPVTVFHSDNYQRTFSAESITEHDRHRIMQLWLQTNQTHRPQYRTEQFYQNKSQTGTSENATSISKPVSKRQRTERSNLHPGQITENSNKEKLTIERNNTNYSSSFSSPSTVNKTVVCGSSVKGKSTESENCGEKTCPSRKSFVSNKRIISMDRSIELNSAPCYHPMHISQNKQSRAYSDSVTGLQNQFVSQRKRRIEKDMQNKLFEKRAKKEATVQVTLIRQPIENHSKGTQKITRGTEASLDVSPSTKKVVREGTTDVSKPIDFIQDSNKNDSKMAVDNQPCGYRKRNAENENDETVTKYRKIICQKNGLNSLEDFLTCSNQDVFSTTNKYPKNPAFDLPPISGPTRCNHASFLEEKTNRITKKHDKQRPLLKTTVTTNSFVEKPSSKMASITSEGIYFPTEKHDKVNGLNRSESHKREERERSKIIYSTFSKARCDSFIGLKTYSNGINCIKNSTNFSVQKPFKNVYSNPHNHKQSSTRAEQRKLLCSSSTATTNQDCLVHSVSQCETERDGFTNYQKLDTKNRYYRKGEDLLREQFSYNKQLDNKRNYSDNFPLQLCKEKNTLTSLVSKDVATVTHADHKNRSCMINRLKVKEFRSKSSQTAFNHNCSPQRKTLVSKGVEAKLRLPLKSRPQKVSVSCQACVELSPVNNVWRQIYLPNNAYKHFVPRPNAEYFQTYTSCPASLKSYNNSSNMYGRNSRTLEFGQQTKEQHHTNATERELYPTESRRSGLGAEDQRQRKKDTKENQQYQQDAHPVSRNSLPIRKRLLNDWGK